MKIGPFLVHLKGQIDTGNQNFGQVLHFSALQQSTNLGQGCEPEAYPKKTGIFSWYFLGVWRLQEP